ncbi:hypothetical protein ACEPAG_4216 [Sanghuangporus baumii]
MQPSSKSDSDLRHRSRPGKAPSATQNGSVNSGLAANGIVNQKSATVALSDFVLILSLVFGGCCINVLSFESLLRRSSSLGTLITFAQMVFITCQSLPYFLRRKQISLLPSLIPRQVPLHVWCLQVLVLLSGSLLNNWSFAFTPLTLQIVFRSSGLPVSLFLGRIFLKRHYSAMQIFSVLLVTIGVIFASLSRPSSRVVNNADGQKEYFLGIFMLTSSLLLTGVLGVLQEQTYNKYGPCWREGVFYTHLLSLPMFAFLTKGIREGIELLGSAKDHIPNAYLVFAVNLMTQLLCVSGVNQLASRVSSVSTNLVLTSRKALSLWLSVWLFGSEWNYGLVTGAVLVFLGSILYACVTTRR